MAELSKYCLCSDSLCVVGGGSGQIGCQGACHAVSTLIPGNFGQHCERLVVIRVPFKLLINRGALDVFHNFLDDDLDFHPG